MRTIYKKINIRGELYDLSTTRIMGVINVTPDSFYSGSRIGSDAEIIKCVEEMLDAGADILDIGGYSSRPGADHIKEEEELERIIRALKIIRKRFPPAVISLDTFRSNVADIGIRNFGVDMVNDISAGSIDKEMFNVIEKHNVPYVLMHMKGNPQNMQLNPVYNDLLPDIIKWFSEKKQELVLRGVRDIIIDPGFGFGKKIEHNFELLNKLERFDILGLPVLVGLSRKSMIWKTLNISPEESLIGTVVLNTIALLKNVSILRVHDVPEAVQAVKLVSQLKSI
ncbi:MAG TPA: dihydropteroate synthase [Bacteroidales bacterium]|nr:dihydropteroate synthase [Bacteroidales bacterium]